MKAVVQSGGRGTRLKPYTMILPKPLMPVGSKPVLELPLKWLRRNGTRDIYITTGYLGNLILGVCGDGCQWDLRIRDRRVFLRMPAAAAMPLSIVGVICRRSRLPMASAARRRGSPLMSASSPSLPSHAR